jgi:hypothetical protein
LDTADVLAVSVGLTAKSDQKISRVGQYRPAMFNRAQGTVKDSYGRSSLVTTVQLRNFEK